MKSNAAKQVSVLSTLFIMSTAYIAVFTSVQGFKAMMPLIQADFNLSGAQSGLYSTFFYLSGVALAIFAGQIVDKVGSKKGLISGVIVIASLMLLHTVMPYFPLILLLAFITGVGFSVVTPAVNKGIIEMVDPSKRAVSNGIVHAGGGIGGIIGSSILPAIGERFGWRVSILLAAGIAFLLAVVLIKRYQPINNNGVGDDEPRDTKADILAVLKNPLVWMVAMMGMVMGLSIGNMTIHYTLFLTGDLGFTASTAGAFLSVFIAGGIIGNPGFGYINDRFLNSNRRLSLAALAFIIAGFFFVMGSTVIEGVLPSTLLLVFTFVFGMFSFATIGMLFTTIGDVAGPKLIGTASGIILISTRLTMVIAPPLIGHLADITGSYALSWYTIAVIMVVVSFIFLVLTASYKSQLRRVSK